MAGFLVGVATWFALVAYEAGHFDCARLQNCSSGDLVAFATVAIGSAIPSSVVAVVISELFRGRRKE
jgi:hypothetical protein